MSPRQDSHNFSPDIEVLLWVGGDRVRVEGALSRTLTGLAETWPDCAVTFLIDGPGWGDVMKPFEPLFRNRKEISLPSASDRPQLLYSLGLLRGTLPFVAFSWPGCEIDAKGLSLLRDAASDADLVYGDLAVEEEDGDPLPSRLLRRRSGTLVPAGLYHPVQYGWLQMLDCIPMRNCLVSRRCLSKFGVFNPSPLLRELFWWDFTIRLSRTGNIVHCPAPTRGGLWTWGDFPFRHPIAVDADSAARYCSFPGRRIIDEKGLFDTAATEDSRFTIHDSRFTSSGSRVPIFDSRLTIHDSRSSTTARSQAAAAEAPFPQGRRPLKIVVLSGLFDAHHSQLYFFNYFERLAGLDLVTWRTILYDTCLPSDLDGNDLVIFSRPRYPECTVLIDHCRQRGIRTLLMIDDNWIAAGREYPRYKALFTPGSPPFEVFLHGLRQADAVLVFNERLEEDVRPLAHRVLRMPPNVELDHFKAGDSPYSTTPLRSVRKLGQSPPQGRRDGTFVVGFAGSPRFEESGFRALARFARCHEEVSVFLMAHEIPEALSALPKDRTRFFPYQHNYFAYARTVSSARLKISLAPLDESRFSSSKSPIKFIETAAACAAGIYSRVAPYTDYVRDGETGLLVENTESSWLDALEKLYGDASLRARIIEAARSEIEERFSTERLIPTFLRILQEAAGVEI